MLFACSFCLICSKICKFLGIPKKKDLVRRPQRLAGNSQILGLLVAYLDLNENFLGPKFVLQFTALCLVYLTK